MTAPRKRNRRQVGSVIEDKSSSPPAFRARYADWSELRVDKNGRLRPAQRTVFLGYKRKGDLPTKGHAEAKWERIRHDYLTHSHAAGAPIPTLAEFVWNVFYPRRSKLRQWSESTHNRFKYNMDLALAKLGPQRLNSITTTDLELVLVDVAEKHCHDTVMGIRTQLRAIFRYAQEEDLILKNPALRLEKPATRPVSRPFATFDQIVSLESHLDGRNGIILQLFTRCGLRAGEVFGLQCGDLRSDGTIQIQRSYSKGTVAPPKTAASADTIPVPRALFQQLLELAKEVESKSADGWLFPCARLWKGVRNPVRSENWLRDVLRPLAQKLGLRLNLHMFRRGFATMAHDEGASVKTVQRQLRHASSSTTMNLYVQPVSESGWAIVEKMDGRFRDEVEKRRQEGAYAANTLPEEVEGSGGK